MNATVVIGREVDRWSKASDARLAGVMGYLEHTTDVALRMGIGPSEFEEMHLMTYVDSDHAPDRQSRRSCSGACSFLTAGLQSRTWALLEWQSKTQKAPGISTGAVETVGLKDAMTRIVVPLSTTLDEFF